MLENVACFLIVAQPKCASTSLMESLGRDANLPFVQNGQKSMGGQASKQYMLELNQCNRSKVGRWLLGSMQDVVTAREHAKCLEFVGAIWTWKEPDFLLHCWQGLPHSDIIAKVPESVLEYQMSSTYLYKNHYPPSTENVAALVSLSRKYDRPVLVLLCDHTHSAVAYTRNTGAGAQHWKTRTRVSLVRFRHHLNLLSDWHDGWQQAIDEHPMVFLKVTKEFFIHNYTSLRRFAFTAWKLEATVDKLENSQFSNLPESNSSTLPPNIFRNVTTKKTSTVLNADGSITTTTVTIIPKADNASRKSKQGAIVRKRTQGKRTSTRGKKTRTLPRNLLEKPIRTRYSADSKYCQNLRNAKNRSKVSQIANVTNVTTNNSTNNSAMLSVVRTTVRSLPRSGGDIHEKMRQPLIPERFFLDAPIYITVIPLVLAVLIVALCMRVCHAPVTRRSRHVGTSVLSVTPHTGRSFYVPEPPC